jgi:surface antigen
MTPRQVSTLAITASAVVTTALVGYAPRALAHSAVSARPAAVQCAAGPTPSARKSTYNTTPSGHGPWRVAHDPCNGEPLMHWDNCAYWAEEKRPDIWRNAVNRPGGGYSHLAGGGAWNIKIDARKYGYRISHKPKSGDIVAWPPNAVMGTQKAGTQTITHFASPGGHVAYVESVRGKRITISSTGLGTAGGYTFTLKFNRHKAFFIHRGRTQ